jgi:hypothetical protein
LAFRARKGSFQFAYQRWCTQQTLKHVRQGFHRDDERLIPS